MIFLTESLKPKDNEPKIQIEQLLIEPYMLSYRDEIYQKMFERLEEQGYDPSTLVFTGFNGTEILKTGTFGDRDETFGMTGAAARSATNSDLGLMDPVRYAETDGDELVVAVYDPQKFMGNIGHEKLRDPSNGINSWQVHAGKTLDDACILAFHIRY